MNINASTNLKVGCYTFTYENDNDIELLDVIRQQTQKNIGYLTHIDMELYPVYNNPFYINGSEIETFRGNYSSPVDLDIYSLVIKSTPDLQCKVIYYYYI